jgi:amino acid transporter
LAHNDWRIQIVNDWLVQKNIALHPLGEIPVNFLTKAIQIIPCTGSILDTCVQWSLVDMSLVEERQQSDQLKPSLSVLESILLTVSGVTPASSVFIIVPVAFASYGTASFWSFVIAAIIGLAMSLCWAELGSTYRTAGGDYAMISRAMGSAFGFANFGLQLILGLFIPAVLALGMGTYLGVLFASDSKIMAAITIVVSTVIALLNVRLGAAITGVFLVAELIALVVISVLGFTHIERPFTELLFPVIQAADGSSAPATLALMMAGVATAIFSYNGYNYSVYFSEETRGAGQNVAKAVLWSLLVVVLAELIPVTAVLLGASSIAKLSQATDLTGFVTERGGGLTNVIVSLAIAGSIFSAVVACISQFTRALYNSGREGLWFGPLNGFFSNLHPQTNTPWGAILFTGLFGIIVVLTLDVISLVTFTGAFLTVAYAMIAIATIWSRIKQPQRSRPYQMPFYPMPPLLALAGLVYVFTQQNGRDILITVVALIVFLGYYFGYIRPSEKRRRAMEHDLG